MAVDHDERRVESESIPDLGPTGGIPRPVRAAVSGVAGAATATLLNEAGRRLIPNAPRMEVIGERALARTIKATGQKPPRGRALYRWAMVGDLVSNSAYYSLVGSASRSSAWRRGAVLGALAGLGAAFLPRPLGLGRQPGERAPRTHLLRIAWYTLAGLAAAGVYRALPDGQDGARKH